MANISENKQPTCLATGAISLTDLFSNCIHDRILINLHAFLKASGLIIYIYFFKIDSCMYAMTMITHNPLSLWGYFWRLLLCGIWVYSSLLRSHCLVTAAAVLSCAVLSLTKKEWMWTKSFWEKISNCILNSKSTPSKVESWQSPLAQAAKTRTMVIACHI